MINSILNKDELSRDDIIALLSAEAEEDIETLRRKAFAVLSENCGLAVNLRGLIEFSNICVNNCFYCGIRRDNRNVDRYSLSRDEILESAMWCATNGYNSIALQSGDRSGSQFINFVEDIIKEIKKRTKSPTLPEGVGITLSCGEQSGETYKRFFEAGAHRYLLRIETTSRELFEKIHPPGQSFDKRIECLYSLQNIGYQVGTGVMIGIPGQTIENLADDILFFRDFDVDMFGMGPYIVHKDTPMGSYWEEYLLKENEIFKLSLKMIAVVRIIMRDVNIASTTALQAMRPDGRESGLNFGANVLMPLLTPERIRKNYLLYEGKPGVDELACITDKKVREQIKSLGRHINDSWGDSLHFSKRRNK